jgi:hypothetical protein
MRKMASESTSFSVLVIDMAHYREARSEIIISGFPTKDEAIEYARRRVRASVEELRSARQTTKTLRQLWAIYGEDVCLTGEHYCGSHELDYFIQHRGTDGECDWQAIENDLGARLQKRLAD